MAGKLLLRVWGNDKDKHGVRRLQRPPPKRNQNYGKWVLPVVGMDLNGVLGLSSPCEGPTLLSPEPAHPSRDSIPIFLWGTSPLLTLSF